MYSTALRVCPSGDEHIRGTKYLPGNTVVDSGPSVRSPLCCPRNLRGLQLDASGFVHCSDRPARNPRQRRNQPWCCANNLRCSPSLAAFFSALTTAQTTSNAKETVSNAGPSFSIDERGQAAPGTNRMAPAVPLSVAPMTVTNRAVRFIWRSSMGPWLLNASYKGTTSTCSPLVGLRAGGQSRPRNLVASSPTCDRPRPAPIREEGVHDGTSSGGFRRLAAGFPRPQRGSTESIALAAAAGDSHAPFSFRTLGSDAPLSAEQSSLPIDESEPKESSSRPRDGSREIITAAPYPDRSASSLSPGSLIAVSTPSYGGG
jgi:hypothetical protein